MGIPFVKDKMEDKPTERKYGQIPIRTTIVCAYIYKKTPDGPRFLILKRASRYMYGLWQQVAGGIEDGETAIQAIIREIKEETAQTPKALYSADMTESFYNYHRNCIMIIPVFAAEFAPEKEVVLSKEHSDFKWVTVDEAKEHFAFHLQKSSIDIINREFALKEPPDELKLKFL
jgi:dihydroneopterin triphosphate diphosphatase